MNITLISIPKIFTLVLSLYKWKLCVRLKRSLDSTQFQVYLNKKATGSIDYGGFDGISAPIKSDLYIRNHEVHVIPSYFHPLLCITQAPFSFYRFNNNSLKILRSDWYQIIFLGNRKPNNFQIASSKIEMTIIVPDLKLKSEITDQLKSCFQD